MSGIIMSTVASYVAPTNGSIQFNGTNSGAYARYAGGTGTAMGTGDFTWECFVYPLYNGNWQRYIDSGADNTFANGYQLGTAPLSYNPVVQATGSTFLTSSIAVTPNIWNHVAITRSGTTVTIWVNGQSGGTATNSLNLTNQKIWIGADASGAAILFGNMSNIRIIKGTAIYTGAFTPPTQPLTAESGTQLLLNTYYGNNFLKDSSPNAFTATNVNLVTSSQLNPFNNNTYYTLASGTKAPVLGAGGQSPFPATGWTSLVSTSQDDTFTTISLPFRIKFNGTTYSSYFPSSNFFITFGTGSAVLNPGVTNPAFNKIGIAGRDNSWQRVSQFPYLTGAPTGIPNYLRLRVEGTANPAGPVGSPNMVYELTFFNPGLTGGFPWIELLVGQQARGTTDTNVFSGICSASAILTGGNLGPQNNGVSPNQSYVLVGDATGTSWTVNTGAYVGNSGY